MELAWQIAKKLRENNHFATLSGYVPDIWGVDRTQGELADVSPPGRKRFCD